MTLKTVLVWFLALGFLAAFALLWVFAVLTPAPPVPPAGFTPPRKIVAPLANEPAHLLFLGTSLTARGDWVRALEAELQTCRAGDLRIEVLAKPGHSVRWGRPALAARLADASAARPDMIVAEFSINDATLLRGLPLVWARGETLRLIEQSQEAGIPLYLATMSPAFGQNWAERPGHANYMALYRELAEHHGTGLVDTEAHWRELAPEERRRLLPDGLHPTQEAMRLITVPAFRAALGAALCP